MGKFINTTYKDSIDTLLNVAEDLIKNPYYLFQDKKACPVIYYNINTEKSMLDEAARIQYSELGENCPFRYNRILDAMLYGIDKIALSLENGEIGLESGDISGEAVVLPGTFFPYVGDYFEIVHIKDTWLFRVNNVEKDTLDDGANIWKINYKLEHTSNENIIPLLADDYNMILNNVGTKFNPIIKSTKYNIAKEFDDICVELKRYYKNLFYNSKVQTFIFIHYNEDRFYDPYMIEFLKKNAILEADGQDGYIYIDHKLQVQNTFSIDYGKTFFKAVEDQDPEQLMKVMTESTADYIKDFGTIFASRPEDYFKMNYKVYSYSNKETPYTVHDVMTCFPKEILLKIQDKELFTEEEINDNKIYGLYNIIIKYFIKQNIDKIDFVHLENMDYQDNITLFYIIPVLIYCLEYEIKVLIS